MKQTLFKEKGINSGAIRIQQNSLVVEGFNEPLSLEETIQYLRGVVEILEQGNC